MVGMLGQNNGVWPHLIQAGGLSQATQPCHKPDIGFLTVARWQSDAVELDDGALRASVGVYHPKGPPINDARVLALGHGIQVDDCAFLRGLCEDSFGSSAFGRRGGRRRTGHISPPGHGIY